MTRTTNAGAGIFGEAVAYVRSDWLVWIVAAGAFASGSVDVVLALWPHGYGLERFAFALPYGAGEVSRTASVVLGFALMYFSFHLLRRQKIAWRLGVVALLLLVIVQVGWRHHPELAFGSVVMLVLLAAARPAFTARSDPRGVLRGLQLMVATLGLAVLWGTVAFYLLDQRDFGREFSFTDALVRTLRQFVFVGNADLVARSPSARWFLVILSVLGATALVLALISILRPVAFRLATAPSEQRRARELVAEYGASPYDFFKLWPDKSLCFAAPRSFVGYRVHHGVAVSLGGPVGPRDELEQAIAGFVQFARDNGWVPAFLMPEDPDVYRRLDLRLVKVGEEATVDLDRFRNATAHNKYFRRVARVMEEQDVVYERHLPPHVRALLNEVTRLSAEWMKQAHYREFGFVQGTLNRGYLEATTLDTLRDREGRLLAFLNEVPSYRPGDATFDLMRRLPQAHWATMDYLFLRTMLALAEAGFRTFNLGLAPFAGVGDDPQASLLEKAMRGVVPHAQRLVRSEGLTQYKRKFGPTWEARYLVYDGGPLFLPQVGIAVTTVT